MKDDLGSVSGSEIASGVLSIGGLEGLVNEAVLRVRVLVEAVSVVEVVDVGVVVEAVVVKEVTAVVESGVVVSELNELLKALGFLEPKIENLPLDPRD